MKKLTINSQDLGHIGSIDTYQTYNGDDAIDSLIDRYNEEHGTQYTYDDFDWTYDHANIVAELAERRSEIIERDSDAVKTVTVVATYSPKYYNYQTDSADFEIEYDEKMVDCFIEKNSDDFQKFLRDSGWKTQIEYHDSNLIEHAKLDYYLNKTMYEYPEESAVWALMEFESEIYEANTKFKLLNKTK